MSIPAAIAQVGQLVNRLFTIFSREEHHERVEDGLITTGDELAKYSRRLYDYVVANDLEVDKKILKYTLHFSRKWQANRKKLR